MASTLYVSDMDGTLLGAEAKLSAYASDSLRRLLEEGLCFTVASARSIASIRHILRGLPLSLPVIEFNGAFLSDLAGRHEVVNAIDPELAAALHEAIALAGLTPIISSFDGSDDHVYFDRVSNDGVGWYVEDRRTHGDPRWRQVSSTEVALREQVVCFTVIAHEQPLRTLYEELKSRYGTQLQLHLVEHLYARGWHWLTVHDARACKSRAIDTLVARYDLSGRERVVFGDQANDLEMFRAAQRAYAVDNASDELKRHATAVIASNLDDGVVRFIETDFRRRT